MSSQGEVNHPNQKIQVLTAQLRAAQEKLEKQAFLIRENEAMVHALLNNDTDPLIIIDNDFKILKCNLKAKKLFTSINNHDSFSSYNSGDLYTEIENGHSILEIKQAFSGTHIQKEKSLTNSSGFKQEFLVNYAPITLSTGQVCAVMITYRNQGNNNLNERIKEHSCRIQIAELCNSDIDIKELLSKAVDIIPEGWQFPEMTSATIQYDGMTISSVNHQNTPWSLAAHKKTADVKELKISVFYHQEVATADSGPFLKEEEHLLETISAYMVSSIDKIIAKEKVQQNEQHLISIWNNEPQCVKIMGVEGNLLDMNTSGLRMIEAEDIANDIRGTRVVNLVHAEDRKVFLELHNNALKGEKGEAQFRITGLKGTQRWMESTAVPLRDKQGNINAVLSVTNDITTKKKAELELRRFREIIENSQDGIAMADHEGRSLYINPGFAQLLGHTSESIHKAGGPSACYADQQIARQVFSTLLEGKHWRGDVKLLNRNGKSIDFFLSAGPIFNENNELIAIYGIHTDISERKKAEQELERAYIEKTTILESIRDAFFAVDHDWKVTYWNKEAEKILGMERHNILGKNLWDVYADAVKLDFYTQYHHAMSTGESVTFEEHYPALKKWFEVTAYPSEKGLSVYFKDISIRKTAEQKIRESNERFEKATEATHDAIWDWDIVNNSLYWGNGFQTLFGHNLKKPLPSFEMWASCIHPKDYQRVIKGLKKVLNNPSSDNFHKEYRFRKKKGEYAYVADRGVVIRDGNGEAIRMVGAMADITHRKEYEASLKNLNEELAISNAELEQFAFVASHDLQEPLRMITSFLSLLKQNYGDLLDENAQKYIHYAVDGATRMRQIILDLLEFSRVGKQKDKLQHVEIREIIEETCNIQKGLISEKNAVIHCDHLPKVISYRTPLSQVFHNLIGNALKYSRKGIPPEIKITAKEGGDYWLVAVQDNGIGIDKEYFNKIFVIFQRLHGKGEYEGTGIGLAIVKKTIENMGGKIWVDSELGNGSTFYFTIKKVMGKYN